MTGEHGHDSPPAVVSNEISGGVFFHAVIQGRDITVQLPPQITPALSGLPAPSPTFAGRDDELEALLQSLAPDRRDHEKPTLVSAISGLAGVGKTELVLQVAHEALRRSGWFPGGALFVDLFGYDNDRRLSPAHALDGLLRALGITGEHIPNDLQNRSRLYRSVLAAYAEQGKRILVVIDNASSGEQVRPLLPSDEATRALVTSRHTLDVGARLHDLDILAADAAVDLIRQTLHHARGIDDTRVDDELEQAKTIAELCGRLPLALQIVAALLADAPTRPLASVAEDLADARSRLGRLRREDKAVRATFDLSYEHLNTDQAGLFRLLSLNAGPDISTEAATQLLDGDRITILHLLEDLARAHLVEYGRTWGRWRMHDLIRAYITEKVDSGIMNDPGATLIYEEAQKRLFKYYYDLADAADDCLRAGQPLPAGPFNDYDEAMTWLDSECDNLIAATRAAERVGNLTFASRLPIILSEYLQFFRRYDDLLQLYNTSVLTARKNGEDLTEASAWNGLGIVLQEIGKSEDALTAYGYARALLLRGGKLASLADLYNNIGIALRRTGKLQEAIRAHEYARDMFVKLGDRAGEAATWDNVGLVLYEAGGYEQAAQLHEKALNINQSIDDCRGAAVSLGNIGAAFDKLECPDEAVTAFRQSAKMFRKALDPYSAGEEYEALARVLQCAERDESEARAAWEAAIIAYVDAGALGQAARTQGEAGLR